MTPGPQKDDISGSERREIVDCKRNPVSYLFFASRLFLFSSFLFFCFSRFGVKRSMTDRDVPTEEKIDWEGQTVLFDSSSSDDSGGFYTSFVADCVALLAGRKGFRWS